MKKIIPVIITLLFEVSAFAQQARTFPQKEINAFFASEAQQLQKSTLNGKENNNNVPASHSILNVLQTMQSIIPYVPPSPDTASANDTLYVGLTPNDTLRISGNWTKTGPIIILNDGVLIFDNANAIIVGDIIALGSGKVFADSSSLFFPQQYWYQRSVILVQNAYINLSNTTLNYGGFPHGFTAVDSAKVILTNITNNDYTTTGMAGKASITINGNNLTGEFIITDSVNLSLKNVTNALLWHHFPNTAVVNHTFPSGINLNAYTFNKNTPGVSGINYSVSVDTSSNIYWALMPVNGSSITISNSVIRSIGLWFKGNDTSNVSGLVNNSNYSNFTAPLSDRVLQLNNTSLQTWSIYPFDSTVINISGCIVGEVGAFGHSKVNGSNFWVDGSGGYWFATDTAFVTGISSTSSSHIRSERDGILFFAYSTQNNGDASAIGKGLLIVVQSALPQDPVPYEGGAVWMANILQPSTHYVDSMVSITGTAFIDRGPSSTWMDFGSYRMYYQKQGDTAWTPITSLITTEVRSNQLAQWNTQGLASGAYLLKLVLKDNWADSAEAVKAITLLPKILASTEETLSESGIYLYPNPSNGEFQIQIEGNSNGKHELKIYDMTGREMEIKFTRVQNGFKIQKENLKAGIYLVKLITESEVKCAKLQIID